MKRFLIALIAIITATQAFAQQPKPAAERRAMARETVSVSGTGRVTVVPDRFTFSVGVQTVAATVDDAVAENNRRVQSVIAALKRAGAADKDIQTSNFNIWPQQDFSEGKQIPRIIGYHVSNNISVRSEKIAEAGKLLGIAIGAGVNTSSGLNFEVSDPARGRDRGLKAAFDDARAKAELLAQAAGRTLGRAVVISEGGASMPPQPMPRAMVMEARAAAVTQDVPVESGSQELTFLVSVTFELR
ncbi:MAG TPA: SIMPL domain-containing protein [Thermoanaerobaculia bacterium]|nr:SIMPL domain-containing protein [Thermoanaerobaculia bacterium]